MKEKQKFVLESWRKCLENDIDKNLGKPKLYEKEYTLRKKIEQYNKLIEVFNNQIKHLSQYNKFNFENYIFLLIDNSGMLLKANYCNERREYIIKKGIKEGVYLTEKSCGTNAISLAMDTCKIVSLSGDEHYCLFFNDWNCIASPLIINDLIIGYVDVSIVGKCINDEVQFIINYLRKSIVIEFLEKCIFKKYEKINLEESIVDVLRYTMEGYKIEDISKELNISESAVKYRRNKLCEMYKAKNIMSNLAAIEPPVRKK